MALFRDRNMPPGSLPLLDRDGEGGTFLSLGAEERHLKDGTFLLL